MLFLLPLGHEQQTVRRIPVVTIGIIVVCFIVHIYVSRRMNEDQQYMEKAYHDIALYIEGHQDRISKPPSPNFPQQYQSVEEYTQKNPVSSFVTAEEKELNNMVIQFFNYRDNMIIYKYAFVPRRMNMLGLITSQFLHGGWLHIIFNMWFFWLAGAILEDIWGRLAFPAFYLLCGIFAALAHSVFYWDSPQPVIGASGAIAGLMGAFLVKFWKTRIYMFYFFLFLFYPRMGTFKAPASILLILWLIQQLGYAMIDKGGFLAVAFWAHIGGFAFGAGLTYILQKTEIEKKYLTSKVEAITTFTQDESVLNAMSAYENNDFKKAENLLMSVLAKQPKNADAMLLMFQIKDKQGDRESAAGYLTSLMEYYIMKNEFGSAIELYRENQAIYPDINFSLSSVMKLATYFKEINELELASRLLHKTYTKHPDDIIGFKSLSYYAEISALMNRHGETAVAYEALLKKDLPEEFRAYIMQKMNAKEDAPAAPVAAEIAPAIELAKIPSTPKNVCGPVSFNICKIIQLKDDGLSIHLGDADQVLPWTSIHYMSIVRIKNEKNAKPYHDYLIIDCIDTGQKEIKIPIYRTFSFNLRLSSLIPESTGGPIDRFITLIEKMQSRSHCIIIQPENLYQKNFTTYELVSEYNDFLHHEIENL